MTSNHGAGPPVRVTLDGLPVLVVDELLPVAHSEGDSGGISISRR